jgi:hypothetical protein
MKSVSLSQASNRHKPLPTARGHGILMPMKFRVTGSNKDNGARMTLEFEADSKAAAERKAAQSGMSVNRVENLAEGYVSSDHQPTSRRGRKSRVFLILVILAAIFWWFFLRPRGFNLPAR